MSWLSGNFSFDVVVSIVTPHITTSPGKPQMDERNIDHHFFPQYEARKNPEKTQFTKLFYWSIEKDTQRIVSTKQTSKRSPNNLKESFETHSDVKEIFVLFT